MADKLKAMQEAGQQVEKDMVSFLLQYAPARELKVEDVLLIAGRARRLAFDQFAEVDTQFR